MCNTFTGIAKCKKKRYRQIVFYVEKVTQFIIVNAINLMQLSSMSNRIN